MATYADTLVQLLQGRFGPSIASQIFDIYLKKLNYPDLATLNKAPLQEQHLFIRNLLERVFGKFYSPQKVAHIQLLCLIQYALNDAASKTQNLSLTLSDIAPLRPTDTDKLKESEEHIQILFSLSGGIEGFLGIMHEPKTFQSIGQQLLGRSAGMDIAAIKDALRKFYDQILSEFSNLIHNAAALDLRFSAQGIGTYTNAVSAKLMIKLGSSEQQVSVYFFLANYSDQARPLLENAVNHK